MSELGCGHHHMACSRREWIPGMFKKGVELSASMLGAAQLLLDLESKKEDLLSVLT